ncbi:MULTISPECIES: ribosomal-processing cysteine protease Prp [Ruminococcus]|uniref:Ribosomal processing cysteine protease Prp n=1 Tax=Ruminococcus flavefaciens TaxID=1265 RepID=A0A1M7KNE6_RUMFL|nr:MULTISPECIES: ribosomal-processing cysteine protease Prp [Ruminococcus]MCR4794979.1 ribosomal-processing cysteine protease Prp [Ruminococcus sp.]SHM66917.1 hypothetical protein SAMN04487860_109117 [Ruminococcus flavefaciens]
MIRAEFYEKKGLLTGFRFSGHSGYADAGEDVACAAVSSAVQLTANILEELGHSPDISVGDNVIECICGNGGDVPSRVLNVLRKHFEAILEEFPNTIKIIISEV